MGNRWEWLHRINTAQGLLTAILGGPAVSAAIHAVLTVIGSPSPPWWGYLVISAVCSLVIAWVILPSRKPREPSASEHELSQTPEAKGRLSADTAAVRHWKAMAEEAYEELRHSHESYKKLTESSSSEISRLKEESERLSESAAAFKIPAIRGLLGNIRLKRHGIITSGSDGERKVVCGLIVGVSLVNPEQESIEIVQMLLTAWPSADRPVRTLDIQCPLGIPFRLQGGHQHAFMVDAQIEFADDSSNSIPQSLCMLLVDRYNGHHFITLDRGETLPSLP